eukprot:bmy_00319T0
MCEMEMKARQLNNRRNKTKSYSPACLRTVQIESKTRRGNCEALRLEIPPPPALLVPRSLPPSVPRSLPPPPSSLRPPPSALPPQCLFQACATGRWRRREGASCPAWRCGSSPPLFIGRQRRFHHFSEKSISFSLPHVAAAGATSGCA